MSVITRRLDRLVRAELSRLGMENTNPATGRSVRGYRVPLTRPNPQKSFQPSACRPSRHRTLQLNVHNICDSGLSCAGLTNCLEISKRGRGWIECRKARETINRECFGGGNREHIDHIRKNVDPGYANCRAAWRANNCDEWNRGRARSRLFFD
ncbi:MAG TPA: hypothetical protein VL614_15985 [Acetobacteraceae bacterium]|jgi:hypothetical protein|nr:hypothetical protein [Acetobacteraceae bacterium]